METLTVGSKAYYDTFAFGLIPCVVVSIAGDSGPASTSQKVIARLTAPRGDYKRGEEIFSSALHIVPRKAVHIHCGRYRIRPYTVQAYTVTV